MLNEKPVVRFFVKIMRERILHIDINDCKIQTFSCGGKGGQNKDRRSTGVRIIHPPSEARGECREERTQLQNKKKAFVKMAESKEFQNWIKIETSRILGQTDVWIKDQMKPENLLIEYS